MRIIAGDYGGRRIAAPPGRGTRPMLDRVREALFSSLQHQLEGARVLDLFAGSGSPGLEALSRGAQRARMVEKHARTAALLQRNVESLGLGDRAEVVRGDALDSSRWRWADGLAGSDLVFVDSPYPLVENLQSRKSLLAAVSTLLRHHVTESGTLVLHVPRDVLSEASFASEPFAVPIDARVRRYGTNDLWLLSAGADL